MNDVQIVGPSVRQGGEKSWDAIVAPGFNGGHRRHQGRITTTNFPSESGELDPPTTQLVVINFSEP